MRCLVMFITAVCLIFLLKYLIISCFLLFFRPGNDPFCWTKEDQVALADVSIVLAADGRVKAAVLLIKSLKKIF